MIKDVDGDAVLENESTMKGLDMKGQSLVTPQGFFGFVAYVPILVVIDLRQELG